MKAKCVYFPANEIYILYRSALLRHVGRGDACTAVKMPKRLGKVEAIYPGPIIKNARASWIARSKFETFLCAAVLGRSQVACALVSPESFPSQHAYLRVLYTPNGRTRLAVTGKGSAARNILLSNMQARMNQGFKKAKELLQGEIDAVTFSSYSFSDSISVCDQTDPGPPPEEGCEWQDGGWSCPGPKPQDDCTLVAGPMWQCPVIGHPDPPDPDPVPDPLPDPDPDPDPCA